MVDPVTRGRPRSEQARRAVLDAALALCERDGYRHVTIKGIADAAGVGRQTIYRWWPTKDDVLLEALQRLAERTADTLTPDIGSALSDVQLALETTLTLLRGVAGQALVGLMAQAQSDPALGERLRSQVIEPRRLALRGILQRGVARGELSNEVPLDLAVDIAFGVLWYRLLGQHAPIDDALAGQITDGLRRMFREPATEEDQLTAESGSPRRPQ
jgi:AcrR family transcriptional regulator